MNTRALAVPAIYISWGIALLSVLGSLYFSEIAGFAPCILCWYQRIFMYPLAILFTVAILRKEKTVAYYALPLAIIGLLISIYHNLLSWGIISEAAAPCRLGVSCTTKFIEWFGFITIPFLSMLSFVAVTAGMIIVINALKKTDDERS